jgi:hypothetical protein
MLSFILKISPPDGALQLMRTRLKPLSSWVSFSVDLSKAIVNSNLLSLFSRLNFQEKFWIIVSRHPVLVFGVSAPKAPFVLFTSDHKYPGLKSFADGSYAVDACAGSRAEYVSPNLTTSPSPETLAGGPYSKDVFMGFGVVSVTLSLSRDLEKYLFHFIGLSTSYINDANLLFGACGQILLVTTFGVSLVASAAGGTRRIPCSGNSEPNLRLWRELVPETASGRASPTASPL